MFGWLRRLLVYFLLGTSRYDARRQARKLLGWKVIVAGGAGHFSAVRLHIGGDIAESSAEVVPTAVQTQWSVYRGLGAAARDFNELTGVVLQQKKGVVRSAA
jgi:hypothetical protein